jgi:hypothetical protein
LGAFTSRQNESVRILRIRGLSLFIYLNVWRIESVFILRIC